jgi:hypothetical protein
VHRRARAGALRAYRLYTGWLTSALPHAESYMRKTLLATLLAVAAMAACTSATAPAAAHDCVNGTWTGSGETC